MILRKDYTSNVSYNYLKEYLLSRNNTIFNNTIGYTSNNDVYSILEQFFNNKTIIKEEKEISIREIPIEITNKIEKCRTTYNRNNEIDKIYVLDTDDWKKDIITAHELGHVYMNLNKKNKDKFLNKETLSVFLEFLVADSYGDEYYSNIVKEKFSYAKSLLIGDYRWYKKPQKIIYINGLVQADILFNKYKENEVFVQDILNDVVNSLIDIDMAVNIIKNDIPYIPKIYSLNFV